MFKVDSMNMTFFIFILFIFFICSVFMIRKNLIKKAMFLEIDEDLKKLEAKEFFLNILKREKFSKIINYVGFLFFLLFSIFIVFQGYQEYILFKEKSNSSINLISFTLDKFKIPIFIWFLLSASLMLALLIKKEKIKEFMKC